EAVEKAKINVAYYRKLIQGFDVENDEGKIVKNETVTLAPKKSKSYAFCSDTVYNENIVPLIKEVDVLYHESTFLEKHEKYADPTKHSTAKQAAQIAKQANVKKLILGHYSTRYDNIEDFKTEANEIFDNVLLAEDGKTFQF
ncbi:MAG: MBL fold metallo-hydrolase, partial [Flavobacteriaceae bacterium]